jgi:hypothetical protein
MAITVENEGPCPGINTDKVHFPSPTVPISVPEVIYTAESGLDIEFSCGGILLHGGVIGDSGAYAEAVEVEVEVEIHDGFYRATRNLAVSKSVAGSAPTLGQTEGGMDFTSRYAKVVWRLIKRFQAHPQATGMWGEPGCW